MQSQINPHMISWLAAGATAVLLAGIALLGRAIGEWARDALLAYAAVLFALLSGMCANMGLGWMSWFIVPLGLLGPFAGLALGGSQGLILVSVAYGALTAMAALRGENLPPWQLMVVTGIVCAVVAARYYTLRD